MFSAVLNNLPADVAIFSAAVSDFKIKNKEKYKIKKRNYRFKFRKKYRYFKSHIQT